MSRARKYSVIVVLVILGLGGVQAGVGVLVSTQRMRGYLTARLEAAFGRPVQVGDFSFTIFPIPELDLEGVTIAEDPAFGHEYFLRAERMNTSLAWTGLLRGHFEFGTMSLTRPSLILVRNTEGRWNLEGWLPPARGKTAGGTSSSNVVATPAQATHLLQKLEFDNGRINFKFGDEKRPFAFTGVSGSVEQVAAGRWRLSLEATPWRSGEQLQSTGMLQVEGDVAGTTARLQPAQIRLHWDKVSVADLFRLMTGNDSGVRGEFALDGNASIGVASPDTDGRPGEWHFVLTARAKQIHRWDLTERSDNPSCNLILQGYWNLARGEARADEVRIELPHSNLNGTAQVQTISGGTWHAELRGVAVQAEDLLAWYRAFTPGIAEGVAIRDFLTGNLSASGWPLRWQEGELAGQPGTLVVPGLAVSRIEPFRASLCDGRFKLDDLQVRLAPGSPAEKTNAKTRAAAAISEDFIGAVLNHDAVLQQGKLRLNVHLTNAARIFAMAGSFGHVLNPGWEYAGSATGSVAWSWGNNPKEPRRTGLLELTKGQLQVAGLNEPLKIEQTRVEWQDDHRGAAIGKIEAFGANWSGNISNGAASEQRKWQFQLHADHLDATLLDRWIGPRARPNWLQRLLPSLLGGSENNNAAHASELLRRVSAEGELSADTISIEKMKFAQARALVSLHDLELRVHDIEAQWAGGNLRGELAARFLPLPQYEIDADVERVNLQQVPWAPRWAERWSGVTSGQVHLITGGVGREELLKQLAGSGTVKLNKVELRGWDVEASAASGNLRSGASRWSAGEGQFEIGQRTFRFQNVLLQGPTAKTHLNGSIGFDMTSDLTFSPVVAAVRGSKGLPTSHELRIRGPLDAPMVEVESLSTAVTKPH
jgi:AsmA family/AsmA-like C-terminal region